MDKDAQDYTIEALQASIEVSRRQALHTLGKVGLGGLAASAALGLTERGAYAAAGKSGYHFVFVNHVTTNPFFTATQYGAADACRLFGCTFQWTGSQNSVVGEMTQAVQTAAERKVDGVAVSIIDPFAFNTPVLYAISNSIPVVSYNSDSAINPRFAYIGQNLFLSGQAMGNRAARYVPAGGHVALFIATPGSLNIQPRIDGAIDALKRSPKKLTYEVIATGALLPHELSTVESYYQSHKNVNGLFAVDAGSTASVAQVSKRYGLQKRGVATGGFDLLPDTINAIKTGDLNFTIDQQPYLQGYYPVLQLYLYKVSNGLMFPSDTNTGLNFVTRATLQPYLSRSRYEGTAQ